MADIPCTHMTVTQGELNGEFIWTCTHCADQFVPVTQLAQAEATLDGIAGVMEAVLWGVMERAVEKYGPEVAQIEDAPSCDLDGHDFHNGTCKVCAARQFIGSPE